MKAFRTQFHEDFDVKEWAEIDGEDNILPSLTIPDQTLTVREILQRHALGRNIEGVLVPSYDGVTEFEDGLPNIAGLDLEERRQLLERTKKYRAQLEDYLRRQQSKRHEPKDGTSPATLGAAETTTETTKTIS